MLTYQRLVRDIGDITLFFEDEALIGLDLSCPNTYRGSVEKQLSRYHPMGSAQELETLQSRAMTHWLDSYLGGEELPCPVAVKLSGTAFQLAVWQALQKIPRGTTCSYGELAHAVHSNGLRAVGTAVGHNPIPILIPCHRVVRADGGLGNFSSGSGPKTKRRLLGIEGVLLELESGKAQRDTGKAG